MSAQRSDLEVLEERFSHLLQKEDSRGRSFRSLAGRELFRVERSGEKLHIPLSAQVVENLFGVTPFPLESSGDGSVIALNSTGEIDLICSLIEVLEEQAEEPVLKGPKKRPRRRKPALPALPPVEAKLPSSKLLTRALLVGVGILLVAFLALSYVLAQKDVQVDRERSIESLLRR